jgi:hypothetical protein
VQRLVERFSQLPEVEAIAIAGSQTTGQANASSDIDLYIYPSADISPEERLAIGHEFSPQAMLNDYWGPGLVWHDEASQIDMDLMFFLTSWMEDWVRQPLENYQAKLGYTTSFCHTVAVSDILFDRNNWFHDLQQLVQQPYPQQLADNIIQHNYPVLRDMLFSYEVQIESALKRQDTAMVVAKVSEFLASYFDIVFALNAMYHPGEKRMMTILEAKGEHLPHNMRPNITALLKLAGEGDRETLVVLQRLMDGLDVLLAKR